MRYLLDTDILIYWLNGNQNIEERILSAGLFNVHYSVIAKAELYFGAYNSRYVTQNLETLHTLSATLQMLPFDNNAAKTFGQVEATLKQKSHLILDADIMVAAIALANGITLVTNNTKHFQRIPGLLITNWK